MGCPAILGYSGGAVPEFHRIPCLSANEWMRPTTNAPIDAGKLSDPEAVVKRPDEAEATISAGVREMACRVNQNASSFLTAADMLARTAHIDLSKESLRKLVEGEGRAVQQAMQQAELTPAWLATECQTEQGTTRVTPVVTESKCRW